MDNHSQSHEQNSENYSRGRSFQQSYRPFNRGRGRARGYPRTNHVQRALDDLGVRDLREHLDRKHQQEQTRRGPPSDPSYSYLKDPLRDNQDQPKVNMSVQRSNSYRGRGRPRSQGATFIQNPMNIKIELSTSTGERNYSVKENSRLADIRHIPDYQDIHHRGGSARGRGHGVRGRGRYIGDQLRIRAKSTERRRSDGDDERSSQIRSKSVEARDRDGIRNSDGEYRGRGRIVRNQTEFPPEPQLELGWPSERPFRGRVRGRGRGRGYRRGRGNQRQNVVGNEVQPASPDASTEYNWDDEVPANISTEKQETVDNEEHDELENDDVCNSQLPDYSEDPEDRDTEEVVKIEDNDNIVVTSEYGDNKKRTVRFDLKGNRVDDTTGEKENDERINGNEGNNP